MKKLNALFLAISLVGFSSMAIANSLPTYKAEKTVEMDSSEPDQNSNDQDKMELNTALIDILHSEPNEDSLLNAIAILNDPQSRNFINSIGTKLHIATVKERSTSIKQMDQFRLDITERLKKPTINTPNESLARINKVMFLKYINDQLPKDKHVLLNQNFVFTDDHQDTLDQWLNASYLWTLISIKADLNGETDKAKKQALIANYEDAT
ncbi:hypothetical protein [Acinetobacter sp. P1(2025)]|uniref:hypothetical protein n=1 Tax=Acinetobacter sp. P1(2025) TaxID=3446120 RepID=UPI003F538C30